ncbi:MAG: helix-turn-helix domain-containing protein [Flavobacterium nitrogenifigens]|uniref:helix-turn-helix domain-containing protein n=1 Tax=Flavobacterium nitrogenifigens TaxID=1617283 RepID=UPI0028079FFF|nr:helix-turn-helix domain-containing protein [Flavobacterium nitrogenifigens]MDQ8013388.1 helix-turn-helix domain-containing protein [Flavobacterium nitrogenifigens]
MIKDLVNIDLKEMPFKGLNVHVIKKYLVKASYEESFTTENLSILLIKSGNFRIKIQQTTHNLVPWDLLVIPKKSYCRLPEVNGKLQLFLISVSSEFAFENCLKKELMESFFFFIRNTPIKIVLEEKEFLVLALISKLIYFISKENEGLDYELQPIGFNLFLYQLKLIYSKYTLDAALNFSRKESLMIQFLTVLSIHCKKQHYVNFYAGVLFVTPGHLNKTVKQLTGKTVKDFITEALILEAKNLLEDTQFSISKIAEELEFGSIFSFSFFFKKHTTFSPTEYRSNSIERFKHR